MPSTLPKPDYLYTPQIGLLQTPVVLIQNQTITALNPTQLPANAQIIDLPGQLLLPGLISGHTHVAAGSPTRGTIESGRSYARPLILVEEILDDDELDTLTAYNLYEIISSGCTTQLEMSLSLRQAQSYVRVATQWGVRGYVGGMIPGIGRLFPIWFREKDDVLYASEQATLDEISANRDFLRSLPQDGLVRGLIAPHAADTHTPETLAAIGQVANELGTGVHIHLSQSVRETNVVRELWGDTPTGWLERLGLFDHGTVFGAHLVGLEWSRDPQILRQKKFVYAHCPSGGGAGGPAQPYPEALGSQLSTNVAIDTHSNDMLENLKLAVLYGQAREALLRDSSPTPLHKPTITDALVGATIIPADALGRPDLGRIAPGTTADLITVDVSSPLIGVGGRPPEPLHHLLYANGRSVTNVMINGRFLVRNGRFQPVSDQQIQQAAYPIHQKLWAQLEKENWF